MQILRETLLNRTLYVNHRLRFEESLSIFYTFDAHFYCRFYSRIVMTLALKAVIDMPSKILKLCNAFKMISLSIGMCNRENQY